MILLHSVLAPFMLVVLLIVAWDVISTIHGGRRQRAKHFLVFMALILSLSMSITYIAYAYGINVAASAMQAYSGG